MVETVDPFEVNLHRLVPEVGRAVSSLNSKFTINMVKLQEDGRMQRNLIKQLSTAIAQLDATQISGRKEIVTKVIDVEKSVQDVRGTSIQSGRHIGKVDRNVSQVLEQVSGFMELMGCLPDFLHARREASLVQSGSPEDNGIKEGNKSAVNDNAAIVQLLSFSPRHPLVSTIQQIDDEGLPSGYPSLNRPAPTNTEIHQPAPNKDDTVENRTLEANGTGQHRTQPTETQIAPMTDATELQDENPPFYRMRTGLNTLREVWREYKKGIDGGPAIEELEIRWRSRWRNSRMKGEDRKLKGFFATGIIILMS